MATTQGRGNAGNRNGGQSGRQNGYVQGNAVRKLQTMPNQYPAIEKTPRKQISNATRKNREKARHMNMGYVLFLVTAMIISGFILTGYIGLQSDITNSIEHIAKLENQLNNLKLANDEEYSRITNSVDLEEVKRVAIQELGMRYAEEGQIIEFTSSGNDYVRQVASISE